MSTSKTPERAPLAARLIVGPIIAFAMSTGLTLVFAIFIGVLAIYLFPFFFIVTLCGAVFGKPKPKKVKATKWVKVEVDE